MENDIFKPSKSMNKTAAIPDESKLHNEIATTQKENKQVVQNHQWKYNDSTDLSESLSNVLKKCMKEAVCINLV